MIYLRGMVLMGNKPVSIKEFAGVIAKIMKTDRWVFLVADGDMGEGKSCFLTKISRDVSNQTKTPFSYQDNITYKRKELKEWIDGKNQKKEYSTVIADELISLFFKRNWFDADQIDGIELLNKCRDRHLFVCGAIPNFWDLDSAIYPITTFWVHIYERGRAWVFRKDRNPFTPDKWNKKKNEKVFSKKRMPHFCVNFVCEVIFHDWSTSDRKEYYDVRNTKRKNTEGQREKREQYKDIKQQRNAAIIYIKDHEKITTKELADVVGLDHTYISKIVLGTDKKSRDRA